MSNMDSDSDIEEGDLSDSRRESLNEIVLPEFASESEGEEEEDSGDLARGEDSGEQPRDAEEERGLLVSFDDVVEPTTSVVVPDDSVVCGYVEDDTELGEAVLVNDEPILNSLQSEIDEAERTAKVTDENNPTSATVWAALAAGCQELSRNTPGATPYETLLDQFEAKRHKLMQILERRLATAPDRTNAQARQCEQDLSMVQESHLEQLENIQVAIKVCIKTFHMLYFTLDINLLIIPLFVVSKSPHFNIVFLFKLQ